MAELIPLPVLFGNPERVSPRISPDGTQLAWIAPHDGVLNVWVAPVGPDRGLELSAATLTAASGSSPGRTTAAICSTCKTPAAMKTGGCTISTCRRWRTGT
jgi:hypothetical protein